MNNLLASVSINQDLDLLNACLPLLIDSKVDALEWSFDTLFYKPNIEPWFEELLAEYSQANRLIGHGVYYSIFSGKFLSEHKTWLLTLESICKKFRFEHITEHFGFLSGADFHKGAPLPVPCNRTTLYLAQDRLKRLQHACACPVGLENLAFAFCMDDVKRHGVFLEKMVEPCNGFIILDLHNLYCQIMNFNIAFDELIQCYPLHLVREIHLSGGSWDDFQGTPIRRDTHDDRVPEILFNYLKKAIALCPNLKFVTLEQMGGALKSETQQRGFRNDFNKMKECLSANKKESVSINNFIVPNAYFDEPVFEDEQLYRQQLILSEILEEATNLSEAKKRMNDSILKQSDWAYEVWTDAMLYTAMQIAQKWKNGFPI